MKLGSDIKTARKPPFKANMQFPPPRPRIKLCNMLTIHSNLLRGGRAFGFRRPEGPTNSSSMKGLGSSAEPTRSRWTSADADGRPSITSGKIVRKTKRSSTEWSTNLDYRHHSSVHLRSECLCSNGKCFQQESRS